MTMTKVSRLQGRVSRSPLLPLLQRVVIVVPGEGGPKGKTKFTPADLKFQTPRDVSGLCCGYGFLCPAGSVCLACRKQPSCQNLIGHISCALRLSSFQGPRPHTGRGVAFCIERNRCVDQRGSFGLADFSRGGQRQESSLEERR